MADKFQAPATIDSVRTLADGGLKLTVSTQVLGPEEMALVFGLAGKLGWFVFAENSISYEDIPDEPIDAEAGEKSPSQRLRGKLYIYWRDYTKQKEPFDNYYRRVIQKEIDKIDEKLT